MPRFIALLIFNFLLFSGLSAQMWNGQDSLYGNEWINFEQSYYKIPVSEDGLYRLDYSTLQNAGLPLNSLSHAQFQIFHLGQEIPLYISASGENLTSGDFIEFYGQKNRSEIDHYLYNNPEEEMLNPAYSLFSDTAAYFLTWRDEGTGLRYEIVENDLTNLPPKEAWYWHTEELVFTEKHIQRTYSQGVSESIFDAGEGFGSQFHNTADYTIPITDAFSGALDSAQYRINLAASTGFTHNLEILNNNDAIIEENFNGFAFKQYSFKKPVSSLQSSETISVNGGSTNNDKFAVGVIKCTYPREFRFQNEDQFAFPLKASSESQYLEIEDFNTDSPVVLYNLTNNYRISTQIDGDLIKAHLPAQNEAVKIILQNTGSGWVNATLSPVNFINYAETNSDFIIISHPALYDDGEGNNFVQDYTDYRSSAQGGNFNVLLVEPAQLYHQFAYGINRHPISIRNFAHYVKKNWADARYLFIIGKGREYDVTRTSQQLGLEENNSFYIPTYGKPGADNLLLASPGSQAPILAVGRIPASKGMDIKYYLDKIMAHEAGLTSINETDRSWRKEIIHLGGGGSPSEQLTLKTHLEAMADIIENNEFGANVFSFYKTSSEPVQQSQSEELTSRINSGVSILTFFGHSGTGGFDFSIDDPTTYQNKDKYPLMISLGCLSGQIHLSFETVGEKFIFQEEKAALGFLATTGYGYIYALNEAAKKIYSHLGSDYYGRGIGEVTKKTLHELNSTTGIPVRTLVQQLTLNGDPSIIINPVDKPDFKIDVASVNFSPGVINAQRDSFELKFTINNIGRAINDSLWLEINRQFPDQSQVLLKKVRIAAPLYAKELTFKLPVLGTSAIGSNRIFITLDSENEIEEAPHPFGEENNELKDGLGNLGVELFVFANQVSTLEPRDFSIVNSPEVTLIANTANPFAVNSNYVFEIDTTEQFNSPLLTKSEFNSLGGILEWTPPISLIDSTVYYWRVSADSTDGFGYLWDYSSFIYIDQSSEGWNQSHFYQFDKDYFDNMEIQPDSRKLKYLEDVKFVRIQNGIYPTIWPSINFNNTPYGYIAWNESTNGGVYIAVMDSTTVDPWLNNPPGQFGSNLDNSWAYGWAVFPYSTQNEAQRSQVIDFLQDTIPSGNYVAIYTIQHDNIDYEPEEWALDSVNLGTNLFQLLENQGATQIRNTATSGAVPYIFVYKKDDDSFTPIEAVGDLENPLEIVFDLPGIWDSGALTSLPIGPAATWEKLLWHQSEVEPNDEITLQITGIRQDASKEILVNNVVMQDTSLNWISANEFPYLQLRYATKDSLNRTSPNLDFWRIQYQGLPDALIDSDDFFTFKADTLQQGEPLELEFSVKNVTPHNMDSLLVSFMILDEENNILLKEKRFQPLPGDDQFVASFSQNTSMLSGLHHMMIELNPHNDQPEHNHINNIGLIDFYVEKDKRNPLLDVTFDSERILDGDLVSAKPHIVISLVDENQYLALSDTTLLNILIKRPGAIDVEPIYFNSQPLEFFPADESNLDNQNKATVEFTPHFTENGIYELIVQGKDATGNQSGSIDFKVAFEVITETSISNILNYPNPFVNSTKFVYTLTGDEAPPYFSIQIMTVSGRIVRTLTQDDLGPLKPGTHQTEYSWDGTDEFGDKLANGVYIYKVTAKDENGKTLDQYKNDSTDRFFQKGYGKLVILR